MEEENQGVPTLYDQKPIRNNSVRLTRDQRDQLYKSWGVYNVESWYEDLKEYTFKTCYFDLPLEMAEIFSKGPYTNLKDIETLPIVQQIQKQVDEAISTLTQGNSPENRKVFVRLSTRSPKDAILLDDERIQKYLVEGLADTVTDWEDPNHVTQAVWSCMGRAMEAFSGEDAVRLLLRSSRVMEDCRIEMGKGEEYSMKVIVREWVDLPMAYEFRTFVSQKKINAISQYFDNCYFDQVLQNKNTLLSLILSLWEKASEKISFQNGIIDFGISSDLNHVYIIECNPFDQMTGGALFDYYTDWEVITGRAEFEFRVIEASGGEFLERQQEGTRVSFLPEFEKAKQIQVRRNDNGLCLVM